MDSKFPDRFDLFVVSLACLAGGLILGVAAWIRVSTLAHRATVITPDAVYRNAQVVRDRVDVEIVTEDGRSITIKGCATIVWNDEEKP
jgi:hypothetical protein